MIGSFKDGQNGEAYSVLRAWDTGVKIRPSLKSRFAVSCLFWPLPAVKIIVLAAVTIMNACRVISLDGQALG